MTQGKAFIRYGIYIALGAVLLALGKAGITDEFWGGMGLALTLVGVVRLAMYLRLRKDGAYREKMEIEASDERNQFIRNKAWAWAGYLFILIASCAVIVLRIAGQELLSTVVSAAVCLMLVLHWGAWLVLRRKY